MVRINGSDYNCQGCTTTNCFIKKHCSEEFLGLINEVKETSIFRESQYVVHEGGPVLGLFFIQKGKIKIVSQGIDGKTQIVRLTKKGDIIGHRGYGGDRYPISAIVIEDSTVCFVDNKTIHKAFMNNPKLTFGLMMYYSKELRKSESKIKTQTQMNVREKVADALLSCDTAFNETNSYPFQIQFDRRNLADLAGINSEQLSRVLSEFKKDGVLSLLKNKIVLNNSSYLKEVISPFGILE